MLWRRPDHVQGYPEDVRTPPLASILRRAPVRAVAVLAALVAQDAESLWWISSWWLSGIATVALALMVGVGLRGFAEVKNLFAVVGGFDVLITVFVGDIFMLDEAFVAFAEDPGLGDFRNCGGQHLGGWGMSGD
ncbi:hypothetical protein BDK51DRAFT_28149 [Blyttiomyces helicus]|uniref:Uncharacterized protein n=1 Tax=Blyttiomyces helicus TaxID=388810 RepID=A0A4P9WB09_9FUNG|nr:hypothetical protein BDK51DRAFT_28149 [Blyttiomyces helicus]|eukprot:RKO89801.1 hypothetical protein BDK51DRAFT_28149 [Blyttiomyces helicus]